VKFCVVWKAMTSILIQQYKAVFESVKFLWFEKWCLRSEFRRGLGIQEVENLRAEKLVFGKLEAEKLWIRICIKKYNPKTETQNFA
jgi:hypothetical protein